MSGLIPIATIMVCGSRTTRRATSRDIALVKCLHRCPNPLGTFAMLFRQPGSAEGLAERGHQRRLAVHAGEQTAITKCRL
jgi:hypothetical protein